MFFTWSPHALYNNWQIKFSRPVTPLSYLYPDDYRSLNPFFSLSFLSRWEDSQATLIMLSPLRKPDIPWMAVCLEWESPWSEGRERLRDRDSGSIVDFVFALGSEVSGARGIGTRGVGWMSFDSKSPSPSPWIRVKFGTWFWTGTGNAAGPIGMGKGAIVRYPSGLQVSCNDGLLGKEFSWNVLPWWGTCSLSIVLAVTWKTWMWQHHKNRVIRTERLKIRPKRWVKEKIRKIKSCKWVLFF